MVGGFGITISSKSPKVATARAKRVGEWPFSVNEEVVGGECGYFKEKLDGNFQKNSRDNLL